MAETEFDGSEEPTEEENGLVDFVIEHTNRWRDYREDRKSTRLNSSH